MQAKEIVTELYSLRAGLSLIAKEKDLFDAEVATAEQQKNKAIAQARAVADYAINDAEGRLSRAKQSSSNVENMLRVAKDNAENKRKLYNENEQILNDTKYAAEYKKADERAMSLKTLCLFFFPIFYLASAVLSVVFYSSPSITIPLIIVVFVMGLTVFILAVKNLDLDEIWYGVPYILSVLSFTGLVIMHFCGISPWRNSLFILDFIVVAGSVLACIILTMIRMSEWAGYDKHSAKHYQDELSKRAAALAKRDELRRRAEEAEKDYEEMKKAYYKNGGRVDFTPMEDDCEKTTQQAESNYNVQCNQAHKQYSATYAASAELHGSVCSGIWDMLVSTYGALLDCRDWGILDLVIWQLETGRAETIKEALQLADRETQTDRIVKTMQSASAAIAQRIDDGFGSLKTQLSNSFYALAVGLANATSTISGQISRSSEVLSGQIGESAQMAASLYQSQKDNMQIANKRLEQLFSQASLQTALLEKSNSSSKELVAAVNNMRKAQA
ncbi:MAG: hypothetical protein K2J01_00210 [Clostridiales bacterium]|nr:hypothetical protein [Clostridiales bacterium]